MKRFLSALLAACLLLGCAVAEAPDAVQGPLIVGGATRLSGNFFSEMFGSNIADQDVRALLHGDNLVAWHGEQGAYRLNDQVVSGMVALDDEAGNRTYTLAICSNLYYSDGSPISAADYAFSLLLSASPLMEALGAQPVFADHILGAEDYRTGAADRLAGVRLMGGNVLAVTVKAAYVPYFYELALLDCVPYPINVIAPGCQVVDDGAGVRIANINQELTTPLFSEELLRRTLLDPETGYLHHPEVVSGPYALESYDAASGTATLRANPYFKGDALGRRATIPQIVYRHVPMEEAAYALSVGEIQLLVRCALAQAAEQCMELTNQGGYYGQMYARSGLTMFSFCCEREAVSHQAVRQAIAYCLNKAAMTNGYVGVYGESVKGYYGLGQWMVPMVKDGQKLPLTAPGEGASDAELQAYTDAMLGWNQLQADFEELRNYDYNLDEAIRLLEEDGWNVNHSGDAYNYAWDDMRCKEIDGEYVPLRLKMYYPEGNAIEDVMGQSFLRNLDLAGIVLVAEPRPMAELLDIYYRQVARDCDIIYLGTNFGTAFDPTAACSLEEGYQGLGNRTGLADEELYRLAVELRSTQPGDLLGYCRKWLAFQERWAEVLPAVPVYSNMYFDFYSDALQGYTANAQQSWAEGILGATWGDEVVTEDFSWSLATEEPGAEDSATPPVGFELTTPEPTATTAATATPTIGLWQPGQGTPPTAAPAPSATVKPTDAPTATPTIGLWQPGQGTPPTAPPPSSATQAPTLVVPTASPTPGATMWMPLPGATIPPP